MAPSFEPLATSDLIFFNCWSELIAPMSVDLSRGLPNLNLDILRLSLVMNLFWIPSWTSNLEPAQQTSPWLNQIESTTPSIALSKSASSKTIKADFPPSSKLIFLSFPAVSFLINLPTSVEPVNAIFEICLFFTINEPVSPSPFTIFTTPGGICASMQSSAKNIAVRGVVSAGFNTTVFPAANAGAIFQDNISNGKFHGIIWPITPNGSFFGNLSFKISAQPAWW